MLTPDQRDQLTRVLLIMAILMTPLIVAIGIILTTR